MAFTASLKIRILAALVFFCFLPHLSAEEAGGTIIGNIRSSDGEPLSFATAKVKGKAYAATADDKGRYVLRVPAGSHTVTFSSVGYEVREVRTAVKAGRQTVVDITLRPAAQLGEAVVTASTLSKINQSAFNATAIDAKAMSLTVKTLGEALAKAPGMKIRESGGVGSDMNVTMDGFTGKHVKVFIDGVPQEGVGSSFGLNNIPVGFADRIEVYRGVVPVEFGSDAIGGAINIVTPKHRQRWFLDASYSYGSFNTHKANVYFGQTLPCGFRYEINAFQNYSDNNYWVDAPVENFATGAINKKKLEHVQRFHDTYHNEAVVAKAGVADKPWADRLMGSFTYSHLYKDVQTGVRQEIVYGQKHRRGHSLMGGIEYGKRNLIARGLDVALTANYSRNVTVNVDTATAKYNWRGETERLNSPGEQALQHMQSDNDNWAATFSAKYRIGKHHALALTDVFNAFQRNNVSLLAQAASTSEIGKSTNKNVLGLSYKFQIDNKFNATAFGKHYRQRVEGPIASTAASDVFEKSARQVHTYGYGAAGTWFIPLGFQFKASYEKACRLPTIEEMFGDEDLEMGEMALKPETSNNINLNLSYNAAFSKHKVYVEAGFIYRDTRDYIQRNIMSLSGGKSAATYVNYGKVETKGFNISARYEFAKWLSIGGNFTQMNVCDNMKTAMGSTMANVAYGKRMPNLPYMFADSDISLHWHGLGGKRNVLTLTYDNQFTESFCYYASNIGSNSSNYMVPRQFAHNLAASYSLDGGRYTLSLECRNLTDEPLYDNFSLQKAGRAFYGKVSIRLGSR